MTIVYQQVKELVAERVDESVPAHTIERLALLVTGIIKGKSASPARVAMALHELGVSRAKPESIERRIRRMENDEALTATLCFHPLAKHHLAMSNSAELLLAIDATTQEDRVVMLAIAVWYRGRSLPIAWAIWPANQPLKGAGFWERVASLLAAVAPLMPVQTSVTIVADRAFGTPAFTDLLIPYGWHYIVRVQGQTRCRDRHGREKQVRHLLRRHRRRAKLRGEAFKGRGWRAASVVVYWGRRHATPLCLVSDLPPRWELLHTYRRRYPIEALFRHFKSYGWQWEHGQVTDLDHIRRLLVGMAWATWLALLAGTRVAHELLCTPPTGRRRTRPFHARHSLFWLGLTRLHQLLHGSFRDRIAFWSLTHWDAPNWQDHLRFHHARVFVFTLR